MWVSDVNIHLEMELSNGFFWSFDAETQIFGNETQNSCTSQIQSNLIKPRPQNPEIEGFSFAVFSPKLLMILHQFFDRALAHEHCLS